MDFSKSIQKAQTVSVCQFCEESPDIKWRCINCDLFLCEICNKRIHKKIKSSLQHEVINLKECKAEDVIEKFREVDLQRWPCKIHNDKNCSVYCFNCKQPVCTSCMIATHKKHKFQELSDVYNTKLTEIQEMKGKVESSIPFFKNEAGKLDNLLLEGQKEFEAKKIKIQQKIEKIQEIQKQFQKLLIDLETEWKLKEEEISAKLTNIKQSKDDLEKREEHLNLTLQSYQASDIFTTSYSLDKSLPEQTIEKTTLMKTKHIPEQIDNYICEILDHLCPSNVLNFELLHTYRAHLGPVYNLVNCDSNSAFVSSRVNTDDKFVKIRFEGDHIKIEKEEDIEVYDMAVNQNGDVLISSERTGLKIYKTDGHLEVFKSFTPLKTCGVHINKNNEIIVGLYKYSNMIKDRLGKVMVLNSDGAIKHTYENDKNTKSLFTYPVRIATTSNGSICVIDMLNDNSEGRIVNYDQGVQWVYTGCKSVNSELSKFTPTDIAISMSDMILITDTNNHSIHVLNKIGEVIVCKDLKSTGIILPVSLDIDPDNIVWIGCFSINDDSKIHAVKLH